MNTNMYNLKYKVYTIFLYLLKQNRRKHQHYLPLVLKFTIKFSLAHYKEKKSKSGQTGMKDTETLLR